MASISDIFRQKETIEMKKGTILLNPEDLLTNAYFIEKGYIQISRERKNTHLYSPIIFKPDEVIPFINLYEMKSFYTFKALTDVKYKSMPIDDFRKKVETDIEATKLMHKITGDIFLRIMDRADQLSIPDAYTKVLARIYSVGKFFGEEDKNHWIIPFPITHVNIAYSIGIARETASINMKILEKQGLMKHKGKTLLIHIEKCRNHLLDEGLGFLV